MKKAPLAVAVCAALFLAGCDGTSSPAGVGAGTGETKASAVSEGMTREKALTIAKQNGSVAEVQLVGLVIEAAQELRPRYQGQFDVGLDNTACGVGMEPHRKAEARQVLEQQANLIIIPGMEMDLFVSGEQQDFNASCLAYLWADAIKPMSAWPRPKAGAFTPEGDREMAVWGAQQLSMALATSATVAPIAQALAQMPGATVAELKDKARQLLVENATAYRQTFVRIAQDVGGRGAEVSINATGQAPAPIHLVLGGLDYQRGPGGALISRNGTTLFGSGYAEGVRYSVAAVVNQGATMTRSATTTATTDQTNTSTINAEARTQ